MGFFDFFKRKTDESDEFESLVEAAAPKPTTFRECAKFDFFWGFTPDGPKLLEDDASVERLGRFLLGNCSGIVIQAMLHPYQVLGQDWNIWSENLEGMIKDPGFNEAAMMRSRGKVGLIELPNLPPFRKPVDDRLDPQVNAIYQRLFPFVIPFLTLEIDQSPIWVERMHAAMRDDGMPKLMREMSNTMEFATQRREIMCGMGRLDPSDPTPMLDSIHEMATTVLAKHLTAEDG